MEKTSSNTNNQNGNNSFDLSNFNLANIDFVKIKEFILKDQKRACKDDFKHYFIFK